MAKTDVAPSGVQGPGNLDRITTAPHDQPDHRWRELTEAVARDWPGHPDPLGAPAVLRRIEALAAQVAGRSPSIRRQVIDDALGHLFLALGSYQRSRPFNPWARCVLRRHAISLYRRQRRVCLDPLFLDAVAAPLEALTEDDLAAVLRDFRRLCDLACFPLRVPNGPALTAVFALETRLRLLDELVCYGPDFLDDHLPLRRWERALEVQPGWPPLGELWARLSVPAEPGVRHTDAIRSACLHLAPGAPVAGLDGVWGTWVHRAKRAVVGYLESHAQARLFFYLFPSNARPARQAS